MKILPFLLAHRKKIENIGKMTQMTQEEIVTNTKTVLQGLEALRVEHMSIIAGLTEGKKDPDKADIIQKNIEDIELGLGEAQVRLCLSASISIPSFQMTFRSSLCWLHIYRILKPKSKSCERKCVGCVKKTLGCETSWQTRNKSSRLRSRMSRSSKRKRSILTSWLRSANMTTTRMAITWKRNRVLTQS